MVTLLLLLFLLLLLMVSATGAMFSLVICFVSLNSENHSTRLLSLFAVRLPFSTVHRKSCCLPHRWILKFNISQPLNSGLGISDLSPEIRNANDDLSQLSRIYFPISIGRTSLFQILEVLGGIFHFQILIEHSVSKTAETLIRRRVLSHKRTLGLCGLRIRYFSSTT